jgi:NAD(P)H-flavin reductase
MIKQAELSLDQQWEVLVGKLTNLLGKHPADLNAVLFLIGVQELGKGTKVFSKEEKQDLMHIATCRVLSKTGFYELEGQDAEGWPHWKLVRPLPVLSLDEQENLLKMHVITYFEDEEIF